MRRIASCWLFYSFFCATLLRAADVDELAIPKRVAYWDHVFEWAYPAYFILFGLASLGAVAAVLVGRRKSGVMFSMSFALLLILCAVSIQTGIDQKRGFIADQERRYEATMKKLSKTHNKEELLRAEYMYLPNGDSLAYATLGNTGLAADYLWLTSMQYVHGAFRRNNKFELLLKLYSSMVDMDPHWIEAEVNAGKILSALEPDRFAVEKFYMRCIRENPDDWSLPYGAGYLFVVPPMNLEQDQKTYSRHAVGWIEDAMRRPQFPSRMRGFALGLKARLGVEASYFGEADAILFYQATDPAQSEDMRTIAARDWMNAHSLVLVHELQQFVDAYRIEHGYYPQTLQSLYRQIPELLILYGTDAFGLPFEYDATTGKVASRGVNIRKAMTMIQVIDQLIELFRGSNFGAVPKDLTELRDWVRDYYKPPHPPATPATQQAIGTDLDPTRSPLGSWNYDPVAGQIVIPEECNSEKLYRDVGRIVNMRLR